MVFPQGQGVAGGAPRPAESVDLLRKCVSGAQDPCPPSGHGLCPPPPAWAWVLGGAPANQMLSLQLCPCCVFFAPAARGDRLAPPDTCWGVPGSHLATSSRANACPRRPRTHNTLLGDDGNDLNVPRREKGNT